MGINNLEQISSCFSDKQIVRDIINAYLEDGLDDIRSLIKALDVHGLDDKQKKEMSLFYITNRTRDGVRNANLRELMCDPYITYRFTPQELKKLLCYYVYDNTVYSIIKGDGVYSSSEKTISEVEDHIVNGLVSGEKDQRIPKNPENKNLYRGLLYVITSNPNIFKHRTSREISTLIYAGLEDRGRVLRGLMTHEGLLKHRSTDEQIELMRAYMNKPYARVERILTDEEVLSNTTCKKQFELLREYNANPTEENLRQVLGKAKKVEDKPITAEEFSEGVFDGR